VAADGGAYYCDNLTIDNGSTFNLTATGTFAVAGNIVNNGTFGAVSGYTSSHLVLIGTTAQSVGGSGTYNSISAFSVGADANVTLGTNISIGSSTTATTSQIAGTLNAGNYSINSTGLTTPGPITFKTAFSTNSTASVTSGSYIISLPDATSYTNANVAVGCLVSGTGIPSNAYIVATSSSSSQFTISKAATATNASAAITISSNGATLTTSNASGVDGSITTAGTKSFGINNYTFNGGVAQATGTLSSNIASLTINNAAGVTISSATTVNKILTIQSGTLTTGGNLSIAPGGYITAASLPNISGTVTLQQSFIGQRGWRVLANPFSTSINLSTVAGNNGITINNTAQASGLTDMRTYDNSANGWANVTGTTLAGNTAYALFYRGLASEVTGNSYTGGPSGLTYKVNGTLNNSSVAVTPTTAGNFMLVGNPYAAPVKTSALTNGTGVSYYVYTISLGADQTAQRTKAGSWAPVLSSSATTTIPVLGAIAYTPAATTSYNITTADILTTGTLQTGLFGTETVIKNLELVVNDKDGAYQDKFFIRSDAGATDKGTDIKDLTKFYNDNVNLYSITGDAQRLAIDARKELNTSIPLGISALAGTYTINVANNNLENTNVYLHDKLNNRLTELKAGSSYAFDITADAASKGENRFELQFLNKATTTIADNNGGFTAKVLGNVISNNQAVKVQVQNANHAVIQIKDLSGKTITTQNAVNGINNVNISKSALGMYIVQTTDGNNTVTEKVVKQ